MKHNPIPDDVTPALARNVAAVVPHALEVLQDAKDVEKVVIEPEPDGFVNEELETRINMSVRFLAHDVSATELPTTNSSTTATPDQERLDAVPAARRLERLAADNSLNLLPVLDLDAGDRTVLSVERDAAVLRITGELPEIFAATLRWPVTAGGAGLGHGDLDIVLDADAVEEVARDAASAHAAARLIPGRATKNEILRTIFDDEPDVARTPKKARKIAVTIFGEKVRGNAAQMLYRFPATSVPAVADAPVHVRDPVILSKLEGTPDAASHVRWHATIPGARARDLPGAPRARAVISTNNEERP